MSLNDFLAIVDDMDAERESQDGSYQQDEEEEDDDDEAVDDDNDLEDMNGAELAAAFVHELALLTGVEVIFNVVPSAEDPAEGGSHNHGHGEIQS